MTPRPSMRLAHRAALVALVATGSIAPAQTATVPLWPAAAPGALGTDTTDVPTITPFVVPSAGGAHAAIVIFPGGGYEHLAFEKEGTAVARWLNTLGISAVVVRYRLGPRYQHPTMEQDGLRAVRYVRANAARLGLDTSRIGVLGFSAGGHLAATVGTRFAAGDLTSADVVDRASSRPDLLMLAYPVITMQDSVTHAGSRRNLIGTSPDAALVRMMSLETQVSSRTPPTFIFATTDDRTVPIANSVRFYDALRAAAVPVEFHVFEKGGHGFGLAPNDTVLSTWKTQAALWLQRHQFVDMPASVAPINGAASDTTTAAIVDARYSGPDGARVGGVPTYRTINAALNVAPSISPSPWIVRIRAGRYREKVSVDKANVRLIGAHRDSTIISWGDAAGFPERGGGTIGTRGSWTLRATVADFRATHLTIENTFDYDANARKPATDTTKLAGSQGLALALTDRSDRAVLDDVVLLGHQDTFFADAGRTYVRHSRIAGNVDFIFGNGRVVFDSTDIVSLDRGSPNNNGYIAAPSTDISTYGFLFLRSRLLKGSPSMAANSVSLGRPWHPSADPRAVGQAVFIECWMDDHISVAGWDRMSATSGAGGERIWFEPSGARFFEYRSTGPGARTSETRRQLSDGDARTYTPALVLDGWIPEKMP